VYTELHKLPCTSKTKVWSCLVLLPAYLFKIGTSVSLVCDLLLTWSAYSGHMLAFIHLLKWGSHDDTPNGQQAQHLCERYFWQCCWTLSLSCNWCPFEPVMSNLFWLEGQLKRKRVFTGCIVNNAYVLYLRIINGNILLSIQQIFGQEKVFEIYLYKIELIIKHSKLNLT
jgi:hypothetical protein